MIFLRFVIYFKLQHKCHTHTPPPSFHQIGFIPPLFYGLLVLANHLSVVVNRINVNKHQQCKQTRKENKTFHPD